MVIELNLPDYTQVALTQFTVYYTWKNKMHLVLNETYFRVFILILSK